MMTVDMDFGFVPGDPVCFESCHIVISKQGDGSVSEQVCNWKEIT